MDTPSQQLIAPKLLSLKPRRDGSTEAHYRLADGRTGYVLLVDGVPASLDHEAFAEAIRLRLPPPAPFA